MRATTLALAGFIALSLGSAASAQPSDAGWASRCSADRCVLGGVIRNVDRPSEIAIDMAMTVDKASGKVLQVRLRFPHYRRGAAFSFAFARTDKDSAGAWRMRLVRGASRQVKIDDCDAQECRLVLPNGVLAATGAATGLDVGEQMLKQDLLLLRYASGEDTYEAATDLPKLQAAYRTVIADKGK